MRPSQSAGSFDAGVAMMRREAIELRIGNRGKQLHPRCAAQHAAGGRPRLLAAEQHFAGIARHLGPLDPAGLLAGS